MLIIVALRKNSLHWRTMRYPYKWIKAIVNIKLYLAYNDLCRETWRYEEGVPSESWLNTLGIAVHKRFLYYMMDKLYASYLWIQSHDLSIMEISFNIDCIIIAIEVTPHFFLLFFIVYPFMMIKNKTRTLSWKRDEAMDSFPVFTEC